MKLLILISHLYIGGFSRSLLNFLICVQKYPEIHISLLMLDNIRNELDEDIPDNVEVIRLNERWYKAHDKSDINVFFTHYRYVLIEYYNKIVRRKDVPLEVVRDFSQTKLSNLSKKLMNDFSFAQNYDFVISWEEEFCLYTLVNKIPARHKIAYIHPNYTEAKFSKRADYPYLKHLDRIVTISDSCCKTLKTVFPKLADKIVCIPNRISKEYYDNLAQKYEPRIETNFFSLLTIARIEDSSKAVFRMVNIIKRLKESGHAVKWYVIGDGPDLAEMKRRIAEQNLNDSVVCLGAMSNPYPYIRKADLYVQQSYYEGRPVSVDEALLLGTPALITDYSSAQEQIQDGVDGWIVENEEEQIYNKICSLIDHPELLVAAKNVLRKRDNTPFEDCSLFMGMLNALQNAER